jgi:hypothetical protein
VSGTTSLSLTPSFVQIKGLIANYGLDQETFTDKYESLKFNIERETEGGMHEGEIIRLILHQMEESLQEDH